MGLEPPLPKESPTLLFFRFLEEIMAYCTLFVCKDFDLCNSGAKFGEGPLNTVLPSQWQLLVDQYAGCALFEWSH
jgi:hypothetical protein